MLASCLRDPWAITQGGLELVLAVASRDALFAEARTLALAARDGEPLRNAHCVEVREGVAIIRVAGPLFRHAELFTEISGATSYAALRKDLQAALDAPAVRAILLDVDSPGGEVNGVAELGDALYAARERKPLVAYVGGQGASAAYWLASAAQEIVAAQTGELGSIGVRLALVDERGAEEQAGIRTVEFVSSQSPNKRVDIDNSNDRARLQTRVDQLADIFVAAVARNRNVSPETVLERFGRGDVLIGAQAVAAGLAERLGSFEDTLARLARRPSSIASPSAQGASRMEREWNPGDVAGLIGLAPTASTDDIRAQAAALLRLHHAATTAFGTTSIDEQAGAMLAAGELTRKQAAEQQNARENRWQALSAELNTTERDQLLPSFLDGARVTDAALARLEGYLAVQRQSRWDTLVREAAQGEPPRLSPAEVEALVPTLLDGGKVTAAALTRLGAVLAAKAPVYRPPYREPAPDKKNRAAVARVSREEASRYGLTPQDLQRYGHVENVRDLEPQGER